MPDPYTYIAKPTDATYTYVTFEGKQVYDDPTITFDSASVFFDSFSPTAYTNIAKPSDGLQIKSGMATGLLTPPTYYKGGVIPSGWIYIAKPN